MITGCKIASACKFRQILEQASGQTPKSLPFEPFVPLHRHQIHIFCCTEKVPRAASDIWSNERIKYLLMLINSLSKHWRRFLKSLKFQTAHEHKKCVVLAIFLTYVLTMYLRYMVKFKLTLLDVPRDKCAAMFLAASFFSATFKYFMVSDLHLVTTKMCDLFRHKRKPILR